MTTTGRILKLCLGPKILAHPEKRRKQLCPQISAYVGALKNVNKIRWKEHKERDMTFSS
jgi:hypothetical protein